jgi:hypothetical protein
MNGLRQVPPEVEYDGKLPDYCGDLNIRIDKAGRWFYHGSPINRKEMVCLFASVMYRAKDGSYLLITPGEMGHIEVEDAPFLAVEMFSCGSGRDKKISFRTNMDELVTVDALHPLRIQDDAGTGEPSPYVTVRKGLEARLTRSVYYDLVSQGWEEDRGGEKVYGVWSSGIFFPLGRLDSSD